MIQTCGAQFTRSDLLARHKRSCGDACVILSLLFYPPLETIAILKSLPEGIPPVVPAVVHVKHVQVSKSNVTFEIHAQNAFNEDESVCTLKQTVSGQLGGLPHPYDDGEVYPSQGRSRSRRHNLLLRRPMRRQPRNPSTRPPVSTARLGPCLPSPMTSPLLHSRNWRSWTLERRPPSLLRSH